MCLCPMLGSKQRIFWVIEYRITQPSGCLYFECELELALSCNAEHSTVDSLSIQYGDGSSGYAYKIDSTVIGETKTLRFLTSHTYGGCGSYSPLFVDSGMTISAVNFVGDWLFTTQSQITYSPFFVNDYSVSFEHLPMVVGSVGNSINSILNGSDIEGDSVSFEIFEPFNIDGYWVPNGVVVTPGGFFSWESPQTVGQYLFIFKVEEWRNSISIGEQYLTMLINVEDGLGISSPEGRDIILKAHPNPTSTATVITWQSQHHGSYQLHLYDAQGRQVASPILPKGEGKLEIDMSGLAKGIYFGQLVVGEEIQSFKLVRE